MGHLKETKIFDHESEIKKHLFLTKFHGWKSKVCYRVPQTMLQWNLSSHSSHSQNNAYIQAYFLKENKFSDSDKKYVKQWV